MIWLFRKLFSRPGRPALLAAITLAAYPASGASPFKVTPVIAANDPLKVEVQFAFPKGHHLYAERIAFRWEGEEDPLRVEMPASHLVEDKFSGEKNPGYEQPFAAQLSLDRLPSTNRVLEIAFQGCDEGQCYFPEKRAFLLTPSGKLTEVVERVDPEPMDIASTGSWQELAAGFEVAKSGTGFMKAGEFGAFLDQARSGSAESDTSMLRLQNWGWLATLGLTLLGGLGLNLTPCILPMIPINLAIIGAGNRASNRRRGLALGAVYGLGMAAAYGTLGLVVVLTGSKFGTLNSSPWFNLIIAIIFGVLCLAMFDKLSIDLSRWQGRWGQSSGAGQSRGPFAVALTMGAVSALLAGACVAPVVISVLLLSAQQYNQGQWLGLLLPFALGLGMALPWPAAGAGLGLLPKPGAWMTRVKQVFGVLIALFALYYAHLAYTLFPTSSVFARQSSEAASSSGVEKSLADLTAALRASRTDGKPVLVDFWASWCKNCSAMEHSTFPDAGIQQRLAGFHLVKFQAERPNDPAVKPVLDHFGAMGLPTYVVLRPLAPVSENRGP